MARNIEAAVFDVDGMLLDTKEFIFQAYEHTLAEHGLPVPDRVAIAREIGRSLADCYATFAPGTEFAALRDTHSDFQNDKHHLIVPYPGLTEMLGSLQKKDIKLAAFSSRHTNLLPSLKNAGILDYFGVVVGGTDVTKHKPHPEGLLKALDALSVSPSHAAMLGDAAVDIQAGKAAAVAVTIGITHGFGTREAIEQAKPDYIVDSLQEITAILVG